MIPTVGGLFRCDFQPSRSPDDEIDGQFGFRELVRLDESADD